MAGATVYTQGRVTAVRRRLNYYRRIFAAYLTYRQSHLTFWHDEPKVNEDFEPGELGQYYLPLVSKANYEGQYDADGIPLLDYHGAVGLQYNPIAIAQYGLGNFNLYRRSGDPGRRRKFLQAADWLLENMERNSSGLWVWNHHFDFEYRTMLRAPWYSALAQGQGISLLVRTHQETGQSAYIDAAERAFQSFTRGVDEGGVAYVDSAGHMWFEEYIVSPPTHILNGFVSASLGVYDYFLATGERAAGGLFESAVDTMAASLDSYDTGSWSLYEQSGTRLKMLASPYYHRLHIALLEVLYRLTGQDVFRRYALNWEAYGGSRFKRTKALAYKALFKLFYY